MVECEKNAKLACPQDSKPSRKPWRALVWILVAGLALRLIIWSFFDGETLRIVDEQHYDELAVSLAETGNFASEASGFTSIRPPLYSWFVSRIYLVSGMRNYDAVRGMQIFLSLLTTICVFGVAREWKGFLSERGALVAAAVFCFYPSLLIQNFFILTETFFTFWLVLVLWTALRFLRTGSLFAISFCGAFIALGALTRSILWLSPLPLALFLLFFPDSVSSRPLTWKRRFAGAFCLLLFAGVGMAPWILRNTKVERTFTPIDCMSGRNLMMGNYEYTPLYRAWDAISMKPPHDWYTILREDVRTRENRSLDPLTQGEKDRLASDYAKRFALENPGLTLKRDAMKALCFWQLERSIPSGASQGFWGFERIPAGTPRRLAFAVLTVTVLLPFVIIFKLSVLGIFSFRFSKKSVPMLALFLAVLFYFWLLHSLVFSHERYHLPLIPILILLAVNFLENWRTALLRLRQSRWRSGAVFVFLGVFGIFWCCEIWWAMTV